MERLAETQDSHWWSVEFFQDPSLYYAHGVITQRALVSIRAAVVR